MKLRVPISGFLITFMVLTAVCEVVFSQSAVKGQGFDGVIRISTFDVDATPPVGTQLTYDPMVNSWDLGLRAKGVVIQGEGQPIVLCSVDWIGISNDSQDEFKRVMAEAAGTVAQRIALHAIHQHDAPSSDFGAEKLLKKAGLPLSSFDGSFSRELMKRLDVAIRKSMSQTQVVTHIGLGQAEVFKVSSNRRILGSDGKVRASRTSATKDASIRDEPEGLIDPMVSLISFWNDDKPVAVLSYYATHPQSYYRTGIANPDFPGVARFLRQMAVPEALHIHFNGAGGNITAGKYNDGNKENRLILAERMADGMKRAWEATKRSILNPKDIGWETESISIPLKEDLKSMEQKMYTENSVFLANNLSKLVLLHREQAGRKIDISCLRLGPARIVNLPGEPFIEYQLAAKAMRKDLFVAVAGYGDYGPGYICDEKGYEQGGYEAGQASAANNKIEKVLMKAISKVLNR